MRERSRRATEITQLNSCTNDINFKVAQELLLFSSSNLETKKNYARTKTQTKFKHVILQNVKNAP